MNVNFWERFFVPFFQSHGFVVVGDATWLKSESLETELC